MHMLSALEIPVECSQPLSNLSLTLLGRPEISPEVARRTHDLYFVLGFLNNCGWEASTDTCLLGGLSFNCDIFGGRR